jgi:hypothetical protein
MIHPDILEAAFDGALVALLWTETEDRENDVNFLETTDPGDVCDVADLARAVEAFMLSNVADTIVMLDFYAGTDQGAEWSPGSLFGHDFTLTANHHGAGFWDRGERTGAAERLTEASHPYGSIGLERGDDGNVYVTGF